MNIYPTTTVHILMVNVQSSWLISWVMWLTTHDRFGSWARCPECPLSKRAECSNDWHIVTDMLWLTCYDPGVVSRNIQRKPSSLQTSPGPGGHGEPGEATQPGHSYQVRQGTTKWSTEHLSLIKSNKSFLFLHITPVSLTIKGCVRLSVSESHHFIISDLNI